MSSSGAPPVPRRRRSVVVETVLIVLVSLAIAAFVRAFIAQAFYIPSGSMENTLLEGDRILVSKASLWFDDVQRGDVVVFQDPGGWLSAPSTASANPIRRGLEFIGVAPSSTEGDLVKRVIGVPGDRVKCCDKQGRVTVNGKPLDEPYLYPGDDPADCPEGQCRFDVSVPGGSLWVMGDHRSVSGDSRVQPKATQFVPENLVVGKVVAVFWPLDRLAWLGRPATFTDRLDPGSR
ncbi:MAG: signal peptidase I [Actinomycetes bacterium]